MNFILYNILLWGGAWLLGRQVSDMAIFFLVRSKTRFEEISIMVLGAVSSMVLTLAWGSVWHRTLL